jgi:hypothetical protein
MSDAFVPLADFRADHFEPYLGKTIRFLRPDSPPGQPREAVELELASVERKNGSPEDYAPFRVPFSLLFRLREGRHLSPDAHTLQVEGLEACDLLVTRVFVPSLLRKHPDAVWYEAVFG